MGYNSGMETPSTAIEHLQAVSQVLISLEPEHIGRIIAAFRELRKVNGGVWIVGNGGSAATASHFANDLRKMASIRAIAMPDLTPTVTAYGNDAGWINMFSYPLTILMRPTDMLVAISCSGKSKNVIEAARQVGGDRLIILTGVPARENELATLAAKGLVYANHPDITVQEDVHLAVCHAIAIGLKEDA